MRSKPILTLFRDARRGSARDGRPGAEQVPAPTRKRLAELPAILASLPRLGTDEAEALGADLERARKTLREIEVPDRWAS
jgi:hypothetical protein